MTYKKLLPALVVIGALALLGCSVGSSDSGAGDSSGTNVQIELRLPDNSLRSLAASPGLVNDPSVTWALVIVKKGWETLGYMGLTKDPGNGTWRGRLAIDEADEGLTTFYAVAGSGDGYFSGGTWLYQGTNTVNTGTAGLATIVIPTLDAVFGIYDWTLEEAVAGNTNATILMVPTNPNAEIFFLPRLASSPKPTAADIVSANQQAISGMCFCMGLDPDTYYTLDCVARLGATTSAVSSIPFATTDVPTVTLSGTSNIVTLGAGWNVYAQYLSGTFSYPGIVAGTMDGAGNWSIELPAGSGSGYDAGLILAKALRNGFGWSVDTILNQTVINTNMTGIVFDIPYPYFYSAAFDDEEQADFNSQFGAGAWGDPGVYLDAGYYGGSIMESGGDYTAAEAQTIVAALGSTALTGDVAMMSQLWFGRCTSLGRYLLVLGDDASRTVVEVTSDQYDDLVTALEAL